MSGFLAERIGPDTRVENAIFGTPDPYFVWRAVVTLCPEAVDCFAYSVGRSAILFGLELRGGARVAVKVHLGKTAEYLAAQQAVQEHVWRYGFPCPRPLGVRGPATLEEWQEDGVHRDGHEPEIRRALAQELVRLTRLTHGLHPAVDLPPFLPRAGGPRWPDALLTIEVPWIDEIARAARNRRDSYRSQTVIAHDDWAVRHFRFRDSKATVVFDWDSVCSGPEAVLVGEASAGFTMEPWPTVDETITFVAEYERARTSRFTPDEHQMAGAAAVYARAYAARRVHAFGGDATALGLEEYAAELLQ
jgi:hypothetical protein